MQNKKDIWNDCPICGVELIFYKENYILGCSAFSCKTDIYNRDKSHYFIDIYPLNMYLHTEIITIDSYVIHRYKGGTSIYIDINKPEYENPVANISYLLDFNKFNSKEKIKKLLTLL